eukprot:6123006-Ditylum_brightwellii.AAC.1
MAVIIEADTAITTTKGTIEPATTATQTTTADLTPPLLETITSGRVESTAIIMKTRTAECSYRWSKTPAKTTRRTTTTTTTVA